jgi:hypothetical protein
LKLSWLSVIQPNEILLTSMGCYLFDRTDTCRPLIA